MEIGTVPPIRECDDAKHLARLLAVAGLQHPLRDYRHDAATLLRYRRRKDSASDSVYRASQALAATTLLEVPWP